MTYLVYRPIWNLGQSRERSLGWGGMMTEVTKLDDMKHELEELRALVNTLLTIIMEEADGVQSGSAQPQTDLPRIGYSM
jgi:hypothetical protein